jgi:hypothetical protein
MEAAEMFFLIEYDRSRGTIVELREFDAASRQLAEDARLDLELELNRQGVDHEVVILDAPSLEALRHTHSRYFESVVDLVCRDFEIATRTRKMIDSALVVAAFARQSGAYRNFPPPHRILGTPSIRPVTI